MNVVVGPEHSETLAVYESDVPTEVAAQFAKEHKLSSNAQRLLLQEIDRQIRVLIEEQEPPQSSKPQPKKPLMKSYTPQPSEKTSTPQCISKQNSVLLHCSNSVGQRLYSEGVIYKRKQARDRALLKAQQEAEEADHPFRPTINENSARLATENYDPALRERRRILLLHQRLNEREEKEQEGCTFHPNINKNARKPDPEHFERLHSEAVLRAERKSNLREYFVKHQYPFKPQVNRRSIGVHNYGSRTTVEKKADDKLVDPVTGQPFFKPVINPKRPAYPRSPQPVLRDEPECIPTELEGKTRSDQLLVKKKIKRYHELFSALGPNSQGCLVPGQIESPAVSAEVQRLLCPVIERIESSKVSVDYCLFAEYMELLVQRLAPHERQVLLFEKPLAEPLSVQPPKSASAKQLSEIFARNTEKRVETLRKIEEEREKLKLCELMGCTFRPKTTRYKKPPDYLF